MIDSVAGAHMVAGICAALLHREKTGKGQEISVSLYQTCSVDALAGYPDCPVRRKAAQT